MALQRGNGSERIVDHYSIRRRVRTISGKRVGLMLTPRRRGQALDIILGGFLRALDSDSNCLTDRAIKICTAGAGIWRSHEA